MNPTQVLLSRSPEETLAIGERIGAGLGPGAIVLLVGSLGAGKTVLARGIARALGIAEDITSPTYTIVSEYVGRLALHHVDLYRIEGRVQLEGLGLDDLLWADGVTVVEWGEKLEQLPGGTPERALRVTIAVAADGSRRVTLGDAA